MPCPSFAQAQSSASRSRSTIGTLLQSVLGVALVYGSSACSFIYDLSADQCKSDRDCKGFGGRSDLVCVQALCVEPQDEPTDEEEDAGVDAGPVGCTSHAQCIEENLDRPHICRDGECIDLYSEECPVVLQPENLKVPEPIIIGAYSSIDELNKLGSPITLSYDLALSEFTEEVGGLAGGPNNTRRKFVAVVCEGADTTKAPLDKSLAHLVDTVGARGIIASLFTDDLREAFDARGKSDNVFFVSPLTADSSLTSQDNSGLLWFMLGAYADLAPAYVALTQRAETFQRTAGSLGDEPIRVALVQGSLAPARDIGQVLLSDPDHSLIFNGEKALSNDEDNFLLVELTSSFEDDEAEANSVIEALSTFKPHIVVVTAGDEFTKKVLPVLESNWDASAETGQVRPFYVMGPLLAFDTTLQAPANVGVRKRLAGINFAADADRTLYNMLKANYQAAYPDNPFYDTENFYDAAYYLMYAIAASGNPAQLSGDSIAEGMLRLVSKSGAPMSVGPSSISDVLAALAVPNSRINLRGALGPGDFNLGTGSRIATGSVWCVTPGAFTYDTLRLNDNGELKGTFPCFTGL